MDLFRPICCRKCMNSMNQWIMRLYIREKIGGATPQLCPGQSSRRHASHRSYNPDFPLLHPYRSFLDRLEIPVGPNVLYSGTSVMAFASSILSCTCLEMT
ncbi:hypothetical protein WA026_009375 [Henosepilachna vigintioctopunctata]|uniref:Uncharacterized protein n=1 Tax=Henosepilachna vigintioctopunctata TaxID=420089 RepID=A0AAW1TY33_9CUCU